MTKQTVSIINKSFEKKDKYNILTFDTHERYQTQLCKTNHNFYSFRYNNCKKWNTEYGDIPENHYILPENSILSSVDFDFILSQSKFGQFQAIQQMKRHSDFMDMPTISLEHTLPISSWPEQQLQAFKQMTGDLNVFISEYSVGRWNMHCDNRVIHHSVDTELFTPSDVEKNGKVLSVVNDFVNRDYCCNYSGWQRITEELPVRLVGDTPGLSETAKDVQELASEYQQASVFLNTSTVSPVPTSLLEAMSCGCAIVSTATCMIPEIIENGVNGFISNDEDELREYTQQLLEDPKLAKKLGDCARQTILEKFSEEKFINNWNEVFDLAYRMKK